MTRRRHTCLSLQGETDRRIIEVIHNGSSLTHAHLRAEMACGIYYFLAKDILDWRDNPTKGYSNNDLRECLQNGMDKAVAFYSREKVTRDELEEFYGRLFDIEDFAALPEDEIDSTGYCVDSLEAAVWSLANTNDYKTFALKAVNLGGDTDSIAAIGGGLAGLFYGKDSIPAEWLSVLARRRYIEGLCAR